MICFPYAGGSAATYLHWAKQLPPDIELISIQPPGRANRLFEAAHTSMDSLLSELFPALLPLFDKPYILFGHSLGSRVAFEVLNMCRDKGLHGPIHFFASGSRGPHIPQREEPIHHLSDQLFIDELRLMGGTPSEILDDPEIMSLYLPMLRADFQLSYDYTYKRGRIFNCPATVFGGLEDNGISQDDLRSWGNYFSKVTNVLMIEGNHFFIDSNSVYVQKKVLEAYKNSLGKL
jgi:surfactin synthase thioesterase subunit